METRQQTQQRLLGILNRIGPGLELTVDERFLIAAFGDMPPYLAADSFAKENNCGFAFRPAQHYGDGQGIFFRAYTKELDSEAQEP